VRGPSSRDYLEMKWDYPVFAPDAGKKVDGTFSPKARKALSREEALAFIAGDDPRPLLVLRECAVCNGTDEALLKGGVDNEKTFLLSAWFHCVKLPVDVMEKDHPFNALFTQDEPEHLFICSVDGSGHDPLESQTSRKELWGSMVDLLDEEYEGKAKTSLKKLQALLDKLDAQDQRLAEVTGRLDEVLEEEGPKSRKVPKLEKKVAKEKEELVKLKNQVTQAYRLELRRQREAARAAEQGDSAQ